VEAEEEVIAVVVVDEAVVTVEDEAAVDMEVVDRATVAADMEVAARAMVVAAAKAMVVADTEVVDTEAAVADMEVAARADIIRGPRKLPCTLLAFYLKTTSSQTFRLFHTIG